MTTTEAPEITVATDIDCIENLVIWLAKEELSEINVTTGAGQMEETRTIKEIFEDLRCERYESIYNRDR